MCRDCPNFLDTPIIVAVGVQSESPENFQGTHVVRKLFAGPALFAEMSKTHSALARLFQCINLKLLLKRVIRCFHINDVCTSHC